MQRDCGERESDGYEVKGITTEGDGKFFMTWWDLFVRVIMG